MHSKTAVANPGDKKPKAIVDDMWDNAFIKVTKATTSNILTFKELFLFQINRATKAGITVATITAIPKADETNLGSPETRVLNFSGILFKIKGTFKSKTYHSSALWIR